MNPLIKELASKALKQPDTDNDGLTVFDNDELTKFAQLIVRECCDWIDGSPATDAGTLLLTKSFITANLKGHFGVEE